MLIYIQVTQRIENEMSQPFKSHILISLLTVTVPLRQWSMTTPDTYVGKTVDVRLYMNKVILYHNGTIIAGNDRDFGVRFRIWKFFPPFP